MHSHENYAARTHPEFVVLDIGDEVGALVVYADAQLHGREVEISPAGDNGHRSHKQVLERSTGGQPAFTAVFDSLRAGTYSLWLGGDAQTRRVEIKGGAVAELDWRGAAEAA